MENAVWLMENYDLVYKNGFSDIKIHYIMMMGVLPGGKSIALSPWAR